MIKSVISFLRDTNGIVLTFKAIDMRPVRLVVISGASFANYNGLKLQLGYVLPMVDSDDVDNVIHYGPNRCKRISRSVMEAKLHGLVLGFDFAYAIKEFVEELLGRTIRL